MEKKRASIGCLFWVALILLVIVIVLFNLKQINQVTKDTGLTEFFNTLFKKEDSRQRVTWSNPEPVTNVQAPQSPQTVLELQKENKINEDIIKDKPTAQPRKTATDIVVKTTENKSIEVQDQQKVASNAKQENINPNLRNANLFFTKITADGKISYIPVKRAVRYSDSPLKSTILALLQGPEPKEINSGLVNLIPEKAILKSIYMRDNTAFLDFNENFRFNPIGNEGLKAQLQQIVYTCTEFINVKNVQILIDGRIVKYLGAEGVFIGTPLTRADF